VSIEAPVYARPSSGGNATLVLILGIVGLLGGLGSCCCCLLQFLALCSPVAWFLGHKELKDIRAGRTPASGEGVAKAGMICGIIGTVFIVLYIIGIFIYIAMVGLVAATDTLKHGGVPIPR